MGPLVAITPDIRVDAGSPTEATYVVRTNYAAALAEAGALPVVLPYLPDRVAELVAGFDGFVVSGSTPGVADVPGRTTFEQALVAAAMAAGRPLLGICNGMQTIGRVLGARLIERLDPPALDGPDHLPRPDPTNVAHAVTLTPGSRLRALAGAPSVEVNSLHRQAIDSHGRFRVAALAADGVVEAIEGLGPGYVLGTQWHPEYRLTVFDRALLAEFVAAARRAA